MKSMKTDSELKLSLAKMLPTVLYVEPKIQGVAWIVWVGSGKAVEEDEWLHVCHLIWKNRCENLSWQQCASTLIKSKNT